MRRRSARYLIAVALMVVACSDNTSAVDSSTTSNPSTGVEDTSAERSTTVPSPGAGEVPPLNERELLVVDRLAALGIEAMRAELPAGDGASMYAEVENAPELLVVAVRSGTDRGEFSVVGQRSVEGVVVETVAYSPNDRRERFDCAGTTFLLWGGIPLGFATFGDFVAAFIAGLAC